MTQDGGEVFANELGGNPRVWATADGYRMVFRYQPGVLARRQEWALRLALGGTGLIAGLLLADLTPHPVAASIWLAPIGLMLGLWAAFALGLHLGEVLTRRLEMRFDDRSITWQNDAGPYHSIPCTSEMRPVVQIVPDEFKMQAMRREIFRAKRKGEPDSALKIVATSGPRGLKLDTILSIVAPDPTEPAVRLVSVINMLIDYTAIRAEERAYGPA